MDPINNEVYNIMFPKKGWGMRTKDGSMSLWGYRNRRNILEVYYRLVTLNLLIA